MKGIVNPKEYDSKVPTNVRLEKALKDKAIQEASDKKINLADVVNNALRERYRGETNNVTVGTPSNMG